MTLHGINACISIFYIPSKYEWNVNTAIKFVHNFFLNCEIRVVKLSEKCYFGQIIPNSNGKILQMYNVGEFAFIKGPSFLYFPILF